LTIKSLSLKKVELNYVPILRNGFVSVLESHTFDEICIYDILSRQYINTHHELDNRIMNLNELYPYFSRTSM